jgi:UDP-2,3-diacylglucosamine hydrolase
MSAQNATASKAQPGPVALFVSDVHLQAALPRTSAAFLDFLRLHAAHAAQLYILGDLFEYWAGDDDIPTAYNQEIVNAIRAVSDAGVRVLWIEGNRDFLIGADFFAATGAKPLADPFVTSIAGQRIVILHGDAQCTDDTGYMAFRMQVRSSQWQQQFLAMPLAQRKAIIDNMREGSREAQRNKACEIMDVNADAIASVFAATDASIMIHGHTHRPGQHVMEVAGQPRLRYVLPDWDCDADQPRGGWLAVEADGSIKRFAHDGTPAA